MAKCHSNFQACEVDIEKVVFELVCGDVDATVHVKNKVPAEDQILDAHAKLFVDDVLLFVLSIFEVVFLLDDVVTVVSIFVAVLLFDDGH